VKLENIEHSCRLGKKCIIIITWYSVLTL